MRFYQSLEKSVRGLRNLFNSLVYMGNNFFVQFAVVVLPDSSQPAVDTNAVRTQYVHFANRVSEIA